MKKFEYKIYETYDYAYHSFQRSNIEEELNILGKDGWEIYFVDKNDTKGYGHYWKFFAKREIIDV